MGSGRGWELIKIYSTLYGLDEGKLTRAQIEQKLKATDPDRLEQAGKAFLAGSELLGGSQGATAGASSDPGRDQQCGQATGGGVERRGRGRGADHAPQAARHRGGTRRCDAGDRRTAFLVRGTAQALPRHDSGRSASRPGPEQAESGGAPEGVGGGTIGAPLAIVDPESRPRPISATSTRRSRR